MYTLVPTASGTATIPPVSVSYLSWPDSIPGELVTEAMTVQIADPLPPVSRGRGNVLWWVVGGVVTAAAGAVVFLVGRRRKARRSRRVIKSPAEQFLEKLTETKQRAAGDLKKFQSGLYDCLAVFLKQCYGIEPDRLSDEEIQKELETTTLPDGYKVQICHWLVQARQDKFRPVSAVPGKITQLEAEIRRVFEQL